MSRHKKLRSQLMAIKYTPEEQKKRDESRRSQDADLFKGVELTKKEWKLYDKVTAENWRLGVELTKPQFNRMMDRGDDIRSLPRPFQKFYIMTGQHIKGAYHGMQETKEGS